LCSFACPMQDDSIVLDLPSNLSVFFFVCDWATVNWQWFARPPSHPLVVRGGGATCLHALLCLACAPRRDPRAEVESEQRRSKRSLSRSRSRSGSRAARSVHVASFAPTIQYRQRNSTCHPVDQLPLLHPHITLQARCTTRATRTQRPPERTTLITAQWPNSRPLSGSACGASSAAPPKFEPSRRSLELSARCAHRALIVPLLLVKPKRGE
jgi:hypothetical protein